MKKLVTPLLVVCMVSAAMAEEPETAESLIKKVIEHYRGETSIAVIEMNVHRPKWQRSTQVKIWTRGNADSLVRVLKPKKDKGAGNLLKNDDMWTFTPKINRVIKLPSSMMNQSWMGSDFTNNDIAKSDDLIDQYDHKLVKTNQSNDHKTYVIESIPKEHAAVVWGKEVVHVRDDYVLVKHEFYDQDGKMVRVLETKEIKKLSGRSVATWQRMNPLEKPGEWTEVKVIDISFGNKIPAQVFTLSNLRNPRD